MSTTDFSLPNKLKDMEQGSLLAGGVGLGIVLLCGIFGVANFFQAWLIGWLFALGFAGGGFIIVAVHNLAQGGWGYLLRRIAEAATQTWVPIMLLFIPLLFSLNKLYPWALQEGGEAVYASNEVIGSKLHYLNRSFFWARYIGITAILGFFAQKFALWSRLQDETGDLQWKRKMRGLAGPLALVYLLLITLGSVDWIMSLEPLWFSSIFGVMMAAGHMLCMLTFGIVFLNFLSRWEPVKSSFTLERQHDLGKLLFAFVVFWTYIQLSQFIIIWHPNLTEEITWYMNRNTGTFGTVSFILFMSQFVIPFLVLLSRGTKRNRKALVAVAMYLLCLRALDMFWMVSPSIHMPLSRDLYPVATKAMNGSPYHILDLLSVVSFGLLWFGLFLRKFRARPVLPVNDPHFSLGAEVKESQA